MTLFFNFSIVTESIRERMRIYWLKSSPYFLTKAKKQLMASGESSVSDPSSQNIAICKEAERLINYRIDRVFGLIKKQNDPTPLLKSGDAKNEEDEDEKMEENKMGTEFNFSISDNHQASIVISKKTQRTNLMTTKT